MEGGTGGGVGGWEGGGSDSKVSGVCVDKRVRESKGGRRRHSYWKAAEMLEGRRRRLRSSSSGVVYILNRPLHDAEKVCFPTWLNIKSGVGKRKKKKQRRRIWPLLSRSLRDFKKCYRVIGRHWGETEKGSDVSNTKFKSLFLEGFRLY